VSEEEDPPLVDRVVALHLIDDVEDVELAELAGILRIVRPVLRTAGPSASESRIRVEAHWRNDDVAPLVCELQ